MPRLLSSRSALLPRANKEVCTLCTPWASDRVVLVADWAGLRRFFGGVAEIQGLEPGSSPTSGTHNPSSEGFLL